MPLNRGKSRGHALRGLTTAAIGYNDINTTAIDIAIGNPKSASVVPCLRFIKSGMKRPTTPKLNTVFAMSYRAHEITDLFIPI